MDDKAAYWNHNTAFHEELAADARRRGGRILDIGCGDGLLLERLAPFAERIVGIDPDAETIERARRRLSSTPNAALMTGDFLKLAVPAPEERFDTITCVATLHHMKLREALTHMRECLKPGGKLMVVGLSANQSALDYIVAALHVLPIRLMDKLHGGMQEIGVRVAEPRESLGEIRKVAREVLPGAMTRRRFYYRYTLTWEKK